MTWYAHILDLLEAKPVRSRPLTWTARCPTHEDRVPSLRIWVGRKNNLIVRCWARVCSPEQVLSAVGLKMGDLFEPEQDGPYQRPARDLPVSRRIVATYDYQDDVGQVLYQAVRYLPKTFAQRRPDGHGAWVWNLEGTRRVLFRLPLLVGKPLLPVLVVEGEKDVLALERLGFLATCNVGGTGMGWLPEYSRMLQDRRVTVIPDYDAAGFKHAEVVLGSLIRHGAHSVRLVGLPGLAEHGDVSDWLAGGGTRNDLIALVRAAPEYSV